MGLHTRPRVNTNISDIQFLQFVLRVHTDAKSGISYFSHLLRAEGGRKRAPGPGLASDVLG